MIRTLIADDSRTFRETLAAILKQDPRFEVVGVADNGLQAVELACVLKPDLILMDVLMPGITGLAATERIMSRAPCPVVVMSGLMNVVAHRLVFEAMRAGAVEVLGKPRDVWSPATRESLLSLLEAMAQVKVVRRRSPQNDPTAASEGPRPGLVAIGCSTGGPPALREILRHLPPSFPAPILIAQHLASGFVSGLRQWLADSITLDVRLAEQGARPLGGCVYLAPDDHHFQLKAGLFDLSPSAGEPSTPSVDRLFDSLLNCEQGVIALLLTGMGSDGAHGLMRLRGRGFHTIVQNEATSLIYGMPKVAREMGAAAEELPIEEMGPRLLSLFQLNEKPKQP